MSEENTKPAPPLPSSIAKASRALKKGPCIDPHGFDAGKRPHSLRLGKGMGIRDLAAVKDGFLVLSGPEALLEARRGANWLADLGGPRSDEGRPEVLMVLDDGAGDVGRTGRR